MKTPTPKGEQLASIVTGALNVDKRRTVGLIETMSVQHISAITLAVGDMARSVEFYQRLGFNVIYGGQSSEFSSLRFNDAFVNLQLQTEARTCPWGRVIFRVNDVDAYHQRLAEAGFRADRPKDASWGERYFHMTDPDGHELSFAELILSGTSDTAP